MIKNVIVFGFLVFVSMEASDAPEKRSYVEAFGEEVDSNTSSRLYSPEASVTEDDYSQDVSSDDDGGFSTDNSDNDSAHAALSSPESESSDFDNYDRGVIAH